MLAQYFREKDGASVIETEGAFLAYHVNKEQFYIADFFIAADFRQSGKHFLGLMRTAYDLAVKEKCLAFTCHVPVSIRDVSEVLIARLNFGFKVIGIEGDRICLRLDLMECSKWVKP